MLIIAKFYYYYFIPLHDAFQFTSHTDQWNLFDKQRDEAFSIIFIVIVQV